jgi:hypothetical protein
MAGLLGTWLMRFQCQCQGAGVQLRGRACLARRGLGSPSTAHKQ